jgi:hypothetical protein
MTVMEILWSISTLLSGFSVIGMLYVYRSMEQSLFTLSTVIHALIINNHRSEYGAGIPSMAKDTEMAE